MTVAPTSNRRDSKNNLLIAADTNKQNSPIVLNQDSPTQSSSKNKTFLHPTARSIENFSNRVRQITDQ